MLVQFNGFISVGIIDIAALIVLIVVLIGAIYKFRQWFKVVPSTLIHDAKRHIRIGGLVTLFLSVLTSKVIAQRDVIVDSKTRRLTHMMVFWGFVGLAFATVWDDIFFRNGSLPEPFSFENLGNIVGNIGGVVLLLGMIIIIFRYALVTEFKKSWKGDLLFLATLFLATITGFATELSRFSSAWFAFDNYALHLAFVTALFVTAPFTHFFHALLAPFMQYIEKIQLTLSNKRKVQYPFYRKIEMSNLAEDVRSGQVTPTYPTWLDSEEKRK